MTIYRLKINYQQANRRYIDIAKCCKY